MSKLRVESFYLSLDGFDAGPGQSLDEPLGVGGRGLHGWAMATPTFQRAVFGQDGGEPGIDRDLAARGFRNVGAWIMACNMSGPMRGPCGRPLTRRVVRQPGAPRARVRTDPPRPAASTSSASTCGWA